MIAVLIIWTYIFFVTFTYGLVAYRLSSALKIAAKTDVTVTAPVLSLVGLCIIMCFLGFYSIFFRIGLAANLIVSIPALLYGILNAEDYRKHLTYFLQQISHIPKLLLCTLLVYGLIIILLSLVTPQSYDTGLYHAQAIQWLEHYKAVIGLGNLHYRLAYNSHFFLPAALFSFSFLKMQPFTLLNSYLFFLFFLNIAYYIATTPKGKTAQMLLYIALLFFALEGFRWNVSSLDTDMPATILIWSIFLIFLEKINEKSEADFDFRYLAIFILCFSTIIIKMTAAAALLFIPCIIFLTCKNLKVPYVVSFCFLAGLLLTPWLFRNVLLSGYLSISFPSLDLFHLDWKLPAEFVKNMRYEIKSWAILPHREIEEVLSMRFWEWFPMWFIGLKVDKKIIFSVVAASPLYILIGILFKSKKIITNAHILTVWFISFLASIFWFFTAPDFRFGFGFLTLVFSIIIFLLLPHILVGHRFFHQAILIGVLICNLFGFWIIYKVSALDKIDFSKLWLLPQTYRRVATEKKSINHLSILVPKKGDQCWDAPMPCTPYLNERIELRGDDFSSGFRLKETVR